VTSGASGGATSLVTVRRGQWVTSTAGRDKGCHYIVLDVIDEKSISVVDGVRRTLAKPKRKNVRHVWVHDVVRSALAEALEQGKAVSDEDIRQALKELVQEREEVC